MYRQTDEGRERVRRRVRENRSLSEGTMGGQRGKENI
jgi:hypothetical protein